VILRGSKLKLRIHIEQDEDGIFIARCLKLPGCISQGKTRDEAIKNIKDAISGYLRSPSIEEEILEISI